LNITKYAEVFKDEDGELYVENELLPPLLIITEILWFSNSTINDVVIVPV
jgi:hypothetical protein